ncbi:MAG: putative endonuclease [Thermoleophilaceae bacterium]|nr:putative endonuclease [Thermoleophilaceae bacterium]MEA2349488.1 putative endonuclease [Thermoleophilaceae bacterium]
MPTDPRRARGALGERIAARHLVDHGYQVLERNFRTRHGELDLVAADERCIVFCEVKTRVAAGRTGPARGIDAIGHAKRRRLRAMAGQWLRDRPPGSGRPHRARLRFDAIDVTLSPGGALVALEHVPDAF